MSLGIGLRGFVLLSNEPHWLTDSSGRGDPIRAASLPEVLSVASRGAFSLFLTVFLLLGRRRIGSKDMVRGFGAANAPISTVSIKEIFRSQLDVAAIEVGRTIVAVIKYEMVPRSNYAIYQSTC